VLKELIWSAAALDLGGLTLACGALVKLGTIPSDGTCHLLMEAACSKLEEDTRKPGRKIARVRSGGARRVLPAVLRRMHL